ncbi:hypothetical protein Tco_0364796 [Tanacetum coccineum]
MVTAAGTKKATGLKQQILFGLKPSDVVMLVLITSQDGLVFGQNIMWTGYECWAESEYMFLLVLFDTYRFSDSSVTAFFGHCWQKVTAFWDRLSVLCSGISHSLNFNLEAVKKIFKYLKGQPRLGLWYPRESPFVLEAYSDSDYAGANKDRKSTTGGCQFLGRRLISWQCKKQTIVATSSTEAEYVAAANCCGQCLKIHIDDDVADLLTREFDGPRFTHLVVNIGMLNQ